MFIANLSLLLHRKIQKKSLSEIARKQSPSYSKKMKNFFEYEFIDISIETAYKLPDNYGVFACEDNPLFTEPVTPLTEKDSNGIPMGDSIKDIEQREIIILDFFERWSATNPERKVYNEKLGEFIYVRAISIIEAKEHSAKSYRSTRAIMIIDEVLQNASPIRRVPKKTGNRNQKEFEYMLVMVYKHPEIGAVKLTVGVRQNSRKIQYGLTALRPDQQLTSNQNNIISSDKKQKKRKPRK